MLPSRKLLKLNLGCGKRQLEGWEGVDAGAYGQEHTADLRQLPFDDEVASHIMAIHVIEHFYLWEVRPLLAEWRRVLVPSGKIILEAPDFKRAVRRMAEGERNPQLTWWVLYGDPGHKDPLQCHRWGWSPKNLSNVLSLCGFENIRQEPAEYKLKDKRDFRIVATRA